MIEYFTDKHNPTRPWFRFLWIFGLILFLLFIVIMILYLIDSNIIIRWLNIIQSYKGYFIGGILLIMIVAFGKTQDKVIYNKNQIAEYDKVIEQYKSVSNAIFTDITLIFYPIISHYIVNGQVLRREIPVYFWEDNQQLHFYEQPPLNINFNHPIHITIPIASIQYFDYDNQDGNQTKLVSKDMNNQLIILQFDHYFYSELYGLIPEKSQEMIGKRRLSNVRAFDHVKSKVAISSQIERLDTLLEKGEITQNEYQKENEKLLENAL